MPTPLRLIRSAIITDADSYYYFAEELFICPVFEDDGTYSLYIGTAGNMVPHMANRLDEVVKDAPLIFQNSDGHNERLVIPPSFWGMAVLSSDVDESKWLQCDMSDFAFIFTANGLTLEPVMTTLDDTSFNWLSGDSGRDGFKEMCIDPWLKSRPGTEAHYDAVAILQGAHDQLDRFCTMVTTAEPVPGGIEISIPHMYVSIFGQWSRRFEYYRQHDDCTPDKDFVQLEQFLLISWHLCCALMEFMRR